MGRPGPARTGDFLGSIGDALGGVGNLLPDGEIALDALFAHINTLISDLLGGGSGNVINDILFLF